MNELQDTETDTPWVQVGRYPSLTQAYDHGLVILAMGEACRVEPADTPGEFNLQAELQPAGKISQELDAYGREAQLAVKPRTSAAEWSLHSAGWNGCAIWVLCLLVVFYWQSQDPTLVARAASSSLGLLDHGEWWRPLTALFLHADAPHLAGNIVGGSLFAALVSKELGAWRAWPMILGCGAIGNVLTAWIHHPHPFLSIGASTAVFAALGILSGLGIAETLRDRLHLSWVRITAPVIAGLILLGWLGGAEPGSNTDVMGHLLGFGCGLAAGTSVGVIRPAPPNS
jgi:rhomboid protease GluP